MKERERRRERESLVSGLQPQSSLSLAGGGVERGSQAEGVLCEWQQRWASSGCWVC